MTAESLVFPALTRRRVRVKPSLFREKSGRTAAFGLGLAEHGNVLVAAGGKKFLEELPGGETLFRTEDGTLFVRSGTSLRQGEDVFALSSVPLAVLSFSGEAEREYYALTSSGLYVLGAEGAEKILGAPGGTAAAFFGERLFVASGETLSYSAPLAPSDWERRADGAGNIVLPSAGGDIGTLVPYRGRLLLFRERGITALAAPGDFLDFEAEEIPYACGKLIPSSVAACGSRVLFCTEEGFFSLKGSTVSPVEGCGAERIDFAAGVLSAAVGEDYFAAVTLVSGEKCLLFLGEERAYFLRLEAESLAGGRELCFLQGGRRYALDRGAAGERAAVLELPLSDFGLPEARYLDAVRVEGEGDFRIEARPQRGLPRFVRGRAGEELRFSPPLRGSSFSLKLRSDSTGAKIAGILLSLREGKP